MFPHIINETFLFSLDSAAVPPHLVFNRLLITTITPHDSTTHDIHNTRHTITSHDTHHTTATTHDSRITRQPQYNSIARHTTHDSHWTRQSQHTGITHMTPQRTTVTSHTRWHYTGRHLSILYVVPRKLLTGACLGIFRIDFWLWLEFQTKLTDLGCSHKHLCRRSGTTLADI